MVVTCPAGDSICNGKYYRPQRVPVASVQPIIHLLQVIQGRSREKNVPNEVLEVDKKTLPSAWELNDHRFA